MSKLIAVLGATGQQGGSVAKACLKAGWKVRALTRDVNKGKALAEQGAEIVAANLDDEASLIKAFEVCNITHRLPHNQILNHEYVHRAPPPSSA